MKKIKNTKWFALGVALTMIVSLFASPVMAQVTRQAELTFRDIRITLNGETLTPTDVHGNEVEPFIYDGTTYLPVRGIANALGLEVDWDDATSTVILTAPEPAATPTPTPTLPPTPAPTPVPTPPPAPAQHPLVGTWFWMGLPYYIFDADGGGWMFIFGEIRWWTDNGVLSICIFPEYCGPECVEPWDWYYVLNGNNMILTNPLDSTESYLYIRR